MQECLSYWYSYMTEEPMRARILLVLFSMVFWKPSQMCGAQYVLTNMSVNKCKMKNMGLPFGHSRASPWGWPWRAARRGSPRWSPTSQGLWSPFPGSARKETLREQGHPPPAGTRPHARLAPRGRGSPPPVLRFPRDCVGPAYLRRMPPAAWHYCQLLRNPSPQT